eukprot:CAMPEP_0175076992 /NCGR_PEP_ID=MMETSP0052_2-20121109/23096_1 /TAXON_ID=51329 ORGANISM="Polytomella parva, Strain SAG 63-3" /NCGR_SAMPLE_ID=MMETSP0052_2 /ASSEMBLY_ACC=CAM_ASM_000194 /LENGTH=468 /DNA_ID=CAMNT_0016346315 /DNA_START=71 /DNA_END=1474 /DNA_ORIENTATION=-
MIRRFLLGAQVCSQSLRLSSLYTAAESNQRRFVTYPSLTALPLRLSTPLGELNHQAPPPIFPCRRRSNFPTSVYPTFAPFQTRSFFSQLKTAFFVRDSKRSQDKDKQRIEERGIFPSPPTIPTFPQQRTGYGLKWTDEYSWMEAPAPHVDDIFTLDGKSHQQAFHPSFHPSLSAQGKHHDNANAGRTALVAEYLRNERQHIADVYSCTGVADMARNIRNEMAARNKAIALDLKSKEKPVVDRIGGYAYKVVDDSPEADSLAAINAANMRYKSSKAFLEIDSDFRLSLESIHFPAYVRFKVGRDVGKEDVGKEEAGKDKVGVEAHSTTPLSTSCVIDEKTVELVLDASLLRHDLALLYKATGGKVAITPHVQQIKLCNQQRYMAYTLPIGEMRPDFHASLCAEHQHILSSPNSSSSSFSSSLPPSFSPSAPTTSELSAKNIDPSIGIPLSSGCAVIVRDIARAQVVQGS